MLSDIEIHELKLLELKRDILVRQLRKENDYKKRSKMNEVLDGVCDQLEGLLECDYCHHRLKCCTCPF